MPPASQSRRLVADIGGTNSRLALFDPQTGQLRSVQNYLNREFASLEDVITVWLETLDETSPQDCCLAVAAPPSGDRVRMLNIDWSFSGQQLAKQFGFEHLRCINDFESNAHSLPFLKESDITTLHAGTKGVSNKLATVGPGTGLGGATLQVSGESALACACEPGHMGLAAASEMELEIFRTLQPRYGEVYAELLVSGPGLQRLLLSVAEVTGRNAPVLEPEQISKRALSQECDLCVTTLTTFCNLLGSICGDFVLANGAYGGLFLAGGIIPEVIPLLQTSDFRQRLKSKGNMRKHLEQLPIHVITCGTAGLIGAAHAPF